MHPKMIRLFQKKKKKKRGESPSLAIPIRFSRINPRQGIPRKPLNTCTSGAAPTDRLGRPGWFKSLFRRWAKQIFRIGRKKKKSLNLSWNPFFLAFFFEGNGWQLRKKTRSNLFQALIVSEQKDFRRTAAAHNQRRLNEDLFAAFLGYFNGIFPVLCCVGSRVLFASGICTGISRMMPENFQPAWNGITFWDSERSDDWGV